MRNKMSDLNNYLFAQLERLDDESLTQEQMEKEVARAKAMSEIAKCAIANANVMLNASKLYAEYCGADVKVPELLE